MNKTKFIKSPIAYMGNKYGLLKKIAPLLPKEIDEMRVIDVFGGSGTFALNFGKTAIYNELNEFTKKLVEFSIKNPTKLMKQCELWFEEYDLNNDRSTLELQEKFKKDFIRFREHVNSFEYKTEMHLMGIYALHVKAINNLIRFNLKNIYNVSGGFKPANGGSLKKLEEITNLKKDIKFESKDYKEFLEGINIKENDLFYFDPPYLNTKPIYNEKGFDWVIKSDFELFEIIDEIDRKGGKFAYSNTLMGKDGTENTHIKEWAIQKGYNLNYIDKKYISFGKLNTKNAEVLITNYKNEPEDLISMLGENYEQN